MYIQAPYTPQPITIINSKIPKVKHVKRNEVPEAYRKERFACLSFIFKCIRKGI